MKFIPCTYDTSGLKLANARSTRRSDSTFAAEIGSTFELVDGEPGPISVRRRSFSIWSRTSPRQPSPSPSQRATSSAYSVGCARSRSPAPENDSHTCGRSAGGTPFESAAANFEKPTFSTRRPRSAFQSISASTADMSTVAGESYHDSSTASLWWSTGAFAIVERAGGAAAGRNICGRGELLAEPEKATARAEIATRCLDQGEGALRLPPNRSRPG